MAVTEKPARPLTGWHVLAMFMAFFGVIIAVNAGLFRLFHGVFGWNRFAAYALSLALVNVLLFLWNYLVGFKTDRPWGDSAWRQGACLAVANALNYALVMVFQGVFPGWPEAVIAVVQVFIAFFKFGLYHCWVFPGERKRDE